ncbi:hypothetical protein MBH78_10525 [Oceanimonas sp. NS1]|nr:hypothetical protein [Oceanimonas sp. NS1]
MLERFQNDLVLFTDQLEQRLHNLAQQPPKDDVELQLAYRYLKKKELLTNAPYAAALCAPWPRIDDHEKYAEWLGVIVLCCCQLHIKGQHDSAISSALREVRLIANDAKHAGIFKQLPMPTNVSSLAELGSSWKCSANAIPSQILNLLVSAISPLQSEMQPISDKESSGTAESKYRNLQSLNASHRYRWSRSMTLDWKLSNCKSVPKHLTSKLPTSG